MIPKSRHLNGCLTSETCRKAYASNLASSVLGPTKGGSGPDSCRRLEGWIERLLGTSGYFRNVSVAVC